MRVLVGVFAFAALITILAFEPKSQASATDARTRALSRRSDSPAVFDWRAPSGMMSGSSAHRRAETA